MRASSLILSDKNGVAKGNNAQAQSLAAKYSKLMETMQKEFFVREGEEAKFQLSSGHFIAYCQINQNGVAFLVHVPEYRRYKKQAKESMSELAWIVANRVIEEEGSLAQKNPQVGVGLKGAMLYGDVMLGQFGEESPSETSRDQHLLELFFIADPAADEGPVTLEDLGVPTE